MTVVLLISFLVPNGVAQAAKSFSWTDAINRAATENPEIAAARENLRANEGKKFGAYAGFLPSIRALVGYESTERTGSSSVATVTGTGWTAGINGAWNLFAGFIDVAKVSQAEADRVASEAALRISIARISAELKASFESVAYARDYAKLTAQILKRREENLRLVQLRFESGRENKGSVLLSEANLEQARYDDLQARNAARTSAAALSKILALSPPDDASGEDRIEVVGNVPVSDPPATSPDFRSLVLMTPEYQQAVEQAKSLEQASRIARASFYPTLDLTSSIARRGTDFFPNDTEARTIGVTLNIPIFSGGRDLGNYRASVASAAAAEYTRDNAIRETRRKLETAWAGYVESDLSS